MDREDRLREARAAGAVGSGCGRLERRVPRDGESRPAAVRRLGRWGARRVGVRGVTLVPAFRCPEREFGDDRICPAKVEVSAPQENRGCQGG